MSVPRATMRLQLHHGFTFADATRLVPYAGRLGISHLYVSPILTARPGSMHGYDVTDPTRVNPELGGENGLRDLVTALRQSDMGLIVDIVPNHMEAGGLENPWWGDVLRRGGGSRYAKFFDIDWTPREPALQGKMLAPFLGEPYGEALRSGSIRLTEQRGEPVIGYYDTSFPIRPEDHAEIAAADADAYDPATEAGRARLHRLLERQHYRLAWWRCAGDEINWRRFFDINSLAGVRIEDDEVFDATHATLLRLYSQGLLDGLRVDHVDGLADPPGYCRRLRERMEALEEQRPPNAPRGRAWLVVEKILGAGEHLPTDWQVDGTSGYDFMDLVNALLHDGTGAGPLRELWASVSGRPADFAIEDVAARHDVLDRSFMGQLDAAASALHSIARARTETRDTTFASIRRALIALLSHFPVYRGYGCQRSPQEAIFFAKALDGAMRECRAADHPVVSLIDRLLGDPANEAACVRFQQLSAPLVAKAVEDTAFYRYGVLLSRNEVGADIARFSQSVQEFHAASEERRERFPDAMLATATHDHKRGEDVRARLAVLSEAPEDWAVAVTRWLELNAAHRRYSGQPMPSLGDELMLYQMIIGAWPVDLDATDAEGLRAFAERLAGWQLKAMREAKLATDWNEPNLDYEDAARSFLYTVMSEGSAFVAEAANLAHRIGPAGAINGLAQTLLKLTAPGIPDLYQGTEFWDQSLVDPDNRRPVDFSLRREALAAKEPLTALAEIWRDGRVKQALIQRALGVRRSQPDLFARGSYQSLEVTGPLSDHIIAFARSLGDSHCIVVVPRLTARLLSGGNSIVIPHKVWSGTELHLPRELHGLRRDAVTDSPAPCGSSPLPLALILREFPLSMLITD
jgi:(1->4)-alpha-D-glucan 1-alpha-D-glucosylmutase